jgi:hypothetical protein
MNENRIKAGASEDAEATKRFTALTTAHHAAPKHWGYRMKGRAYHIGANGATEPPKGDLALEALGG